ncbi:SGNH/GDSL hydrolase family protein [Mucilaginibacter terrae]|uniref:SGNH/GDSL hydrolase family protein n=1 Tax=Mucilaginibacter terrae TaxID=1955052 RepID=UPI00362D8070
MKKMFKYTLLVIIFLASTAMQPVKPKRVIFFGDSITWHGPDPDGFITLMQNRLKENKLADRYELIGAGVSGNKIYDLYFRLNKDVLSKNPDMVFIYIGVNDVWHKIQTGTGTDLNRFEKFYSAIIEQIQAAGAKVVLCTPAVIGEKKANTNEQDGDLNLYAKTVNNLAVKYKCEFIDLRKEFTQYNEQNNIRNEEKGVLTRDKVHLNAAGNQMVAKLMYDKLVM